MIEQTIERIHHDLRALGIKPGDTLLIHASYKSLGPIEGGAKTFFDAVLSYLGEDGTLVMPALSFTTVTEENPYFDVRETPSCVGYLTEYFRTSVDGVMRSLHATHSCCAKGKWAKELTADHEKDDTPVGKNSPFYKLLRYEGKILFLGCTTNHNTLMHGVQEEADLPYLFDREHLVEYIMTDANGNTIRRPSYRHYFVMDGKRMRSRYSLLEPLLNDRELTRGSILQANCTLLSARAVWDKALEQMRRDPMAFIIGFVD